MPNKSKISDHRFWRRWARSGALYNHQYACAPRGDDECAICEKPLADVPIGCWIHICRECSDSPDGWGPDAPEVPPGMFEMDELVAELNLERPRAAATLGLTE